MADFGGLAAIGEAFVAAALDPSRWNAAMDVAAGATGSFGAILIPAQHLRGPRYPYTESLARPTEAYAKDGWFKRDLRDKALPLIRRRGVGFEFDFITSDEIARHPYYQEFLAPHGMRWFAGIKVGDGRQCSVLSLQRTIAEGPFSPNELGRLAGLSCRLSSAAELARAFNLAGVESALQAFEISGSAVAMIDRNGQALKLNASAERLLGSDLKVVGRRIVSFNPDATAALDRTLHAVIWLREDEALRPPVVLPRRLGRPILAYPSRAPGAFDPFATCSGFVVFVDLDARRAVERADLISAFGLTPAEARLANKLIEGQAIETAAEELGVTYETARKFLKNVFAKTDTHRQSELVALLAQFAQRSRSLN